MLRALLNIRSVDAAKSRAIGHFAGSVAPEEEAACAPSTAFAVPKLGENKCLPDGAHRRRCVMTMCLVSLVVSVALAQKKTAPPPPKPADKGPSLVDTMKFIQDKLTDQNKII